MAEEEILGEEEATREGGEDTESGGGLFDFSGGMFDSLLVRILLGAIVLVLVVLMSIGVSIWAVEEYMKGNSANEAGEVKAQQRSGRQQSPLRTFDLENDFIITKKDPRTGRTRTLKLHIKLAYNKANAGVKSELSARKDQIRDMVYGVLGSRNVEQLNYKNKQDLQDELVSEINKLLTSGNRIQQVYFTNYVYQ